MQDLIFIIIVVSIFTIAFYVIKLADPDNMAPPFVGKDKWGNLVSNPTFVASKCKHCDQLHSLYDAKTGLVSCEYYKPKYLDDISETTTSLRRWSDYLNDAFSSGGTDKAVEHIEVALKLQDLGLLALPPQIAKNLKDLLHYGTSVLILQKKIKDEEEKLKQIQMDSAALKLRTTRKTAKGRKKITKKLNALKL